MLFELFSNCEYAEILDSSIKENGKARKDKFTQFFADANKRLNQDHMFGSLRKFDYIGFLNRKSIDDVPLLDVILKCLRFDNDSSKPRSTIDELIKDL